MKNLSTLGAYIQSLIDESAGGVANRAAKMLGVSAAELHALRNGTRQSPNPAILKKISEKLNGDYRTLFELSGYVVPGEKPTITQIAVVSEVAKGVPPETNLIYYEGIPTKWLRSNTNYFAFREYSLPGNARIAFYYLISSRTDFKDGDEILASWDDVGAKIYLAYHIDEKRVELLGKFTCERNLIINPDIFGVVEMVLVDRVGKYKN